MPDDQPQPAEHRRTGGGGAAVVEAGGEPVGASHLGQLVELVWQLRGEAGARQVSKAKVGVGHVLGAGGNCAVTVLKK